MSEPIATLLKVYKTKDRKNSVCEILCPKCNEIHHHGYDENSKELSLRSPHCWNEEKVISRGYDLLTGYLIPHGYPSGYGCSTPQFVLYRMFDSQGDLHFI